jgi:hypothetical protein
LKSVKLGPGTLGDLVEVAEGLNAADKVIAGGREGLTDGQRINITGQELGSESTTPAAEPKSKAGAGRLPTGSGTKGK